MSGWIRIGGVTVDYFWHCFGTERHRASRETVLAMMAAADNGVLPINTHALDAARRRENLEIGFAGVSYDSLAVGRDLSHYTKMLNINLRTSAQAAVRTAKLAVEMTGERVLKLEVLNEDLRGANDARTLDAAAELRAFDDELVVLPLLSNDRAAVKEAVAIGCPLVRVMGSPISSGRGIDDPDAFAEICAGPVPVILDGGIGVPEHIHTAARLGAAGVLVNSVLFDGAEGSPRAAVKIMRDAADRAFGAGSTDARR